MRATYTITIFTGALLLFLVQPMVGKLVLPWLGGTPAVWNTCMMFFQAALLAGYAYAHLLTKLRDQRTQILVHGIVMACAVISLPIALRQGNAPTEGSPVLWLVVSLLLSVGLPFFVVSSNSPLLQRWFAETDDPSGRDPYFLYAASNAGSLLALLAYPLLVEPLLTLHNQAFWWAGGYGLFAVLTVSCGIVLLRRPRSANCLVAATEPPAPVPSRVDYAKWAVLAFVPSSLMLGVTQHITTDIAAIPLLWVVPLTIYLLTFILAFSRWQIFEAAVLSRLFVFLAIPVVGISVVWASFPVWLILLMHLALLFVGAMMCHVRLAQSRPHPHYLTGFFLAIAVGGALGGVFNAVIAPQVFSSILEYPLVIALAFLLRDRRAFGRANLPRIKWTNRVLDGGMIGITVVCIPLFSSLPGLKLVARERSFFGVHRVATDTGLGWTGYFQGSTLHGIQMAAHPRQAMGYYHRDTGIGQLYLRMAGDNRLDRVAVIGLGAGTLAAQARPGQHYTIYEIDPSVVKIAQNDRFFTYLSDAPHSHSIVLGDGRISLAREPDGAFGLIVLDAFSSDAVPVHLITSEAIDLYFDKLTHNGLLAINATSRHLDLSRLVGGLARDRGLVAIEWAGATEHTPSFEEGKLQARWLVMGRSERVMAPLLADPLWQRVPMTDDLPVWTDQFSNMLAIFDWWQ